MCESECERICKPESRAQQDEKGEIEVCERESERESERERVRVGENERERASKQLRAMVYRWMEEAVTDNFVLYVRVKSKGSLSECVCTCT